MFEFLLIPLAIIGLSTLHGKIGKERDFISPHTKTLRSNGTTVHWSGDADPKEVYKFVKKLERGEIKTVPLEELIKNKEG